MTVLALTPTRLVYSHTDEHPAGARQQAARRDQHGGDPVRQDLLGGPQPRGARSGGLRARRHHADRGHADHRLERPFPPGDQPAHCGDESCEADHGYLGTITADDFSLRVSQAADGEDAVRQLLSFARELSDATAVGGNFGAHASGRRPLITGPGPDYQPIVAEASHAASVTESAGHIWPVLADPVLGHHGAARASTRARGRRGARRFLA